MFIINAFWTLFLFFFFYYFFEPYKFLKVSNFWKEPYLIRKTGSNLNWDYSSTNLCAKLEMWNSVFTELLYLLHYTIWLIYIYTERLAEALRFQKLTNIQVWRDLEKTISKRWFFNIMLVKIFGPMLRKVK